MVSRDPLWLSILSHFVIERWNGAPETEMNAEWRTIFFFHARVLHLPGPRVTFKKVKSGE